MAREIPSLRVLSLRAVGSHDCDTEKTFARKKNGKESSASQLLQALHSEDSTLERLSCVGPSSTRRAHANDVDIDHPFVASGNNLEMQYGNVALDCLQSYIDSLVELGRMDDKRLGKNFFREYIKCCTKGQQDDIVIPRKRKRSSPPLVNTSVGSLSLHNCSIAENTFEAMISTKASYYTAVLDLTGIQNLTDGIVTSLVKSSPNLERLCLKNCRRLTVKSLRAIAENTPKLTSLDLGGCVNISAQDVLQEIPNMSLTDLNASGLGWNDDMLLQLVQIADWQGLSVSFSNALTTAGLRNATKVVKDSLQRLSIAFCEDAVDSAFLGYLGKLLPHLVVLDIRGNSQVNSLTSWFDGRSASLEECELELFVLARYTSISKANLEETKRIHPLHTTELTCILDGGGTGMGIRR